MIHSKLKRGKLSQLLVEFSRNQSEWPQVIQKFYENCIDEGVKVNRTAGIGKEMLRFYTVKEQTLKKGSESNGSESMLDLSKIMKTTVSQIQLVFTVIYMNDEQQKIPQFQDFFSNQNITPRVLLLRQTLSPIYDLDYQVQETLSPNQSISYLCELSASILNSKYEEQIEQYHHKKQLMIRKGNQGQLSSIDVIWRNILFQIPGIGKDKVKAIAQNYPTYEKILQDCQKKKTLRNLVVGRGTKGAKIGSLVAQRIYKIFGSLDQDQKLY